VPRSSLPPFWFADTPVQRGIPWSISGALLLAGWSASGGFRTCSATARMVIWKAPRFRERWLLNKEQALKQLMTIRPTLAQVDPNGRCNCRCWYCPVAYEGNPASARLNMTTEMFDHIIEQLKSAGIHWLYMSHYNEMLLHPGLADLFAVLKKHGMSTMILTNGTPLTPDRVKTLIEHKEQIGGICVNAPASNLVEWAAFTRMRGESFQPMVEGIRSLLPDFLSRLSIQVNGNSAIETARQVEGWQRLIPGIHAYAQTCLSDRAGRLAFMGRATERAEAQGCRNGDRWFSFIHINARGDLFLCCDDFEMKYQFGNVSEAPIDELWCSERHAGLLEEASKEICSGCMWKVED
jgi:radical SAM protein with 4Fe4S-binding SPASM domain